MRYHIIIITVIIQNALIVDVNDVNVELLSWNEETGNYVHTTTTMSRRPIASSCAVTICSCDVSCLKSFYKPTHGSPENVEMFLFQQPFLNFHVYFTVDVDLPENSTVNKYAKLEHMHNAHGLRWWCVDLQNQKNDDETHLLRWFTMQTLYFHFNSTEIQLVWSLREKYTYFVKIHI